MKNKGDNFTILVMGDGGSGKSTLVNTLLGKTITTQDSAPSILSTFHTEVQGVPVTVHETSGVENLDAERNADYRNEMCTLLKGGEVDVIIYCLALTETRLRDSIPKSFQGYHSMGLNWRKTVIALTFANSLPIPKADREAASFDVAEYFKKRANEFSSEIKKTLKRVGVTCDEAEAIQVIPTQDDAETALPNGEQWYEPFWSCLLRCWKVAPLPPSTNSALQPSAQNEMVPTDDGLVRTPPASNNVGDTLQTHPSSNISEPSQSGSTRTGTAKNECTRPSHYNWCTWCCISPC